MLSQKSNKTGLARQRAGRRLAACPFVPGRDVGTRPRSVRQGSPQAATSSRQIRHPARGSTGHFFGFLTSFQHKYTSHPSKHEGKSIRPSKALFGSTPSSSNSPKKPFNRSKSFSISFLLSSNSSAYGSPGARLRPPTSSASRCLRPAKSCDRATRSLVIARTRGKVALA